uniref:Late embryogenesis abundant protein LEA-2 subgroup domain-containing protein n=1 Tax=Kalanchoe fedtschenkoi TaxID=63787 RepID=A0A7N0RHF0_KALFE
MGDDSRPPATGYPVHPYPPPQQAANGYAQQPSSAYPYPPPHQQHPNPYFYNSNYQAPPRDYHVDQQRNAFLRRMITAMIAVFVIFCVIFFITWLVLRPKFPEFRVDSASVTGFNLSSSVSGAWVFGVTVSNPNKKVDIVYEEVESSLAYDYDFIADSTLAPFTQGKRNVTTIRASFAASGSYLNDRSLARLNRDRGDDGVVGFQVRIYSRALFNAGVWRVRRRLLRVLCDDLRIAIGSNGAGNMTGGPKGCIVGW